MGNRAVIKFKGAECGVYLHWNGGRDSVEPFLGYCKARGFRCDDYGVARMAQVVGNWFGGSTCIGVINTRHHLKDLDPGDNGVYIVKDWEIVGRYPKDVCEQRVYDYDEFIRDLDAKQPERDRLGDKFFNAEKVRREDLKIGDTVLVQDWDGNFEENTIIGFGEDIRVNGTDVKGLPFTGKYSGDAHNINNYLRDPEYLRT